MAFTLSAITGLIVLLPESWRVKRKYGCPLALVCWLSGAVILGCWLWVSIQLLSQIQTKFSYFLALHLVTNVVGPIVVFFCMRRRYSTTPSLLPAAGTFAGLTIFFVGLSLSVIGK